MRSPSAGFDALALSLAPPSISINAPDAPTTMPPAFLRLIGSRSMIQASSITHIGIVVVTRLASLGVVRLTPNIKHPWLSRIPRRPAPQSNSLSRSGTCSRGMNNDVSQNSAAAPAIRKSTRRNGATTPDASTSFTTGDINPQVRLAQNIARCPFRFKSLIICNRSNLF